MDGPEGVRKSEGVGLWAGLSNDLEGSLEPSRQLAGWSSRSEVLRLDKDFLSDFDRRWRSATGICRTLIAFLGLGDVLPQGLMEFIEVSHEISGSSGRDVTIGVNGDGGVVAFVGIEGRDTGGGVRSVVVRELRERKKRTPVILLEVNVSPEVLFQSLIDSFSLSVSFRVITGGEMYTHVQCFSE